MAKEKVYVQKDVFDSLISLKQKFDKRRDYVSMAISDFEPHSFIQSIDNELIIGKFLNDEIDIGVKEPSYYWYSRQYNKYIGKTLGSDYSLVNGKNSLYTESQIKANTLYDVSKFEKIER